MSIPVYRIRYIGVKLAQLLYTLKWKGHSKCLFIVNDRQCNVVSYLLNGCALVLCICVLFDKFFVASGIAFKKVRDALHNFTIPLLSVISIQWNRLLDEYPRFYFLVISSMYHNTKCIVEIDLPNDKWKGWFCFTDPL